MLQLPPHGPPRKDPLPRVRQLLQALHGEDQEGPEEEGPVPLLPLPAKGREGEGLLRRPHDRAQRGSPVATLPLATGGPVRTLRPGSAGPDDVRALPGLHAGRDAAIPEEEA